ncbi:hypothetical protein HK104_003406 [Borealophlyctis nickersoniae]|nr:hypothetical protein HK104_003406 [Borealophlyctis nickersoniae]
MSKKNFSLEPLKDETVFQVNSTSAVEKVKNAELTTAQIFEQLGYLLCMGTNALVEVKEMKNHLARNLARDDFTKRNTTLTKTDLERFISITLLFEWFAYDFPNIAHKIKAGLKERNDNERIRELEEQIRQLKKQQNGLKRKNLNDDDNSDSEYSSESETECVILVFLYKS